MNILAKRIIIQMKQKIRKYMELNKKLLEQLENSWKEEVNIEKHNKI